MGVLDVNQQKLVEETAKELKKLIEMPEWAHYIKTSPARERPPLQDDWYFLRAASILKYVYKLGPIGVSKLSRKYGGRKNRGMAPEHTYRGSRKVIRYILQQLEKVGLVEQKKEGQYKGRIITSKGHKLLSDVAKRISSEKGKN